MSDRAQIKEPWIHSNVVLSSEDAIGKVDRHELVEISAGYSCKLVEKPGYHEGKPYKFVQREIRYNHVSLLPPGHARAGSDARLRLDSQHQAPHFHGISQLHTEEPPMSFFRMDASKATATLGSDSFDLRDPEKRKELHKKLNGLVTARKDQMDPTELAAKVGELQAIGVSLVEGINALASELAAESELPADVSVEEMEAAIGVEAMDKLAAKRADIVHKGKALGVETEGKNSVSIMREVLDARNINTKGLEPSQVADFYARIPVQTFDSKTADIARSGPAAGGSNDDKVLAESLKRRGSAWKANRKQPKA
jgi:hypothetical protein